MAKYSRGSSKKVGEVMHEMKEGKLKTGTGKKVTSRKQAIAIGLSEARERGDKVPNKRFNKKGPAKKYGARSSSKSSSPSQGRRKTDDRYATAKKTPGKKMMTNKSPLKKIVAKKSAPKKFAPKKAPVKQAAKKAAPKKLPVKTASKRTSKSGSKQNDKKQLGPKRPEAASSQTKSSSKTSFSKSRQTEGAKGKEINRPHKNTNRANAKHSKK